MKKRLALFMGVAMTFSLFSQSELKVFEDWSTTAGTQHFFYKNVTQTDKYNNVYVAGATMNGAGNYDILLAKYNSSGVQQWIQQVDGLAHHQDFATKLFIDVSDNVYITGAITNDSTTFYSDLFIRKYNSSGTLQWQNTYNGTGSLYDCGTDILVNTVGVVCVTGSSFNASANLDFITLYTIVQVFSSGQHVSIIAVT